MSIIYNNKTISGRGKDGKDGAGYQIGDIGYALYVDETKGTRRRLNGSVVAKNTNTQQFFDYLNGLQTSAPSLFTTEDNWQSELTLSKLGQCGKFVLSENQVRLPKVVNINGLQDLTQAGVRLDESLPNITGSMYSSFGVAWVGVDSTSGAFTVSGSGVYDIANKGGADNNSQNVNFDASRSSSTYQDNAPVQQEAIQYPFFIQIAVTSETVEPITNTLALNNAYSFGDSKYLDIELNNISWLKSEGQWISKTVYPDYFNWVLTNATNGVDRFKFSTDEYDDYDWVVNGSNETFRLPLKNGQEAGIGTTAPVITSDSSLYHSSSYPIYFGSLNSSKPIINANTYPLALTAGSGALRYSTSTTATGSQPDITPINLAVDLTNATVSPNMKLYFYVGETVQNANIIDAGRIQEQFAGLRTVVEVSDKSILPSWYRVYSDGWCEQGGKYEKNNGVAVNAATISLLKNYNTTNYNINAVAISSGAIVIDCYDLQINRDNVTTSSFSIGMGANSLYWMGAYWYACGYIR